MGAQRVGDGSLDGVGMGEADDDGTRVGSPEGVQRADDPGLHSGESLAVGEAESGRVVLDGLPLRQACQAGERRTGPVAEVALQEPGILADGEPSTGSGRLSCLPCPFQG